MHITDEQIATFKEQGFLIIENFLPVPITVMCDPVYLTLRQGCGAAQQQIQTFE